MTRIGALLGPEVIDAAVDRESPTRFAIMGSVLGGVYHFFYMYFLSFYHCSLLIPALVVFFRF